MERKLNCTLAASAMSAMIPSLGLPKDSLFALHDVRDIMADQLVTGMGITRLAAGDNNTIISGPLNADQAAVLGVVSAMTHYAIDVIAPQPSPHVRTEYDDGGEAAVAAAAAEEELGAAHEPDECCEALSEAVDAFRAELAEQLGIAVESVITVPGTAGFVIDALGGEPSITPVSVEDFYELGAELCIPAEVRKAADDFASKGIEPDDILCITASEFVNYAHGQLGIELHDEGNGFYASAEVREQLPEAFGGGEPGPATEEVPFGDYGGVPEEGVKAADSDIGSPYSEREDILMDAAETVGEIKNAQYGEPEDNLAAIAAYWSVYFGAEFSPEDVAMMMALLKVARIETGAYSRYSYIDAAGFLALAGVAQLSRLTTPTIN